MTASHLYLHVPFCRRKCGYCAFSSVPGAAELHGPYLEALLVELDRLPHGDWHTLHVGGGTPTILGAEACARLLAAVPRPAPAVDREWTVEANPTVAAILCFTALAAGGVNRISLGVQSTNPRLLAVLERAQDPGEATEVVSAARERFLRVGIDLIVGIPGQTEADIEQDVIWAAERGVDHVSAYALSLDPGSRLHARGAQRGWTELDGRSCALLLERAWTALAAAGYAQYETSNFSRPGGESRHNLAYWLGADYAAAGAAAVSTLDGVRRRREPDPAAYIAAIGAGGDAVVECETLTPAIRLAETWMLGLRLVSGVSRARLVAVGDDPARWEPLAAALAAEGLLVIDAERVALTPAGRLVQDAVTVRLLPSEG